MYFQKLTDVKNEMLENSSIEILVNLPEPEDQSPFRKSILEVLKVEGFSELHKDLLKLANECNLYKLYWRWQDDDQYGGEVGLQSIAAIFRFGWTNKLWFDKSVFAGSEFAEQLHAFSHKLYGFDDMEESAQSNKIAAFYIDKEKLDPSQPLNPEVWYWHADKYKLTLNYSQYLDKILLTRGFFNWQQFFLDWDGMDWNDPFIRKGLFGRPPAKKNMEEFLEIMPKIFPDQDYTEYHQLYNNWVRKAKEHGF